MQDGHAGPVKQARTFGAFTHREALPRGLREQERWHVRDLHEPASPIRGPDPNGFIAGHLQHVGIAMGLQPGAEVQMLPIDAIAHDPGNGELGFPHPLQHASSQFRFGLETNR